MYEAVVAYNKLASCSLSRDNPVFPHIRSLPAAMGWMCVAPAKSNPGLWVQHLFAGTQTTRIGLSRASASADNNPTGKEASPHPREWRVGREEPGRAFAPGLLSTNSRGLRVARVPPRRKPIVPARSAMRRHMMSTHRIAGRLLTPSAHRACVLQTFPEVCEHTQIATRRDTKVCVAQTGAAFNAFRPQGRITRRVTKPKVASHKRGGF